MSSPEQAYTPIDCNYYDRLEAWSITHTLCVIDYVDEQDKQQQRSGLILDLYTQQKVEYMKLYDDSVIRLDRIIAVNNIPVPGSCYRKLL